MAAGGLQAVFLAQRPMLVRLLTARLGNADDAEDVLQDMWLRLDGLADRPVAQPAAFLFRIAANMATDRRLSGERRGARDHGWFEAQDASDDLPDAERALIGRDRLRRIEAAMADMPERMRIALTMFRIEERPQREIAARLEISVSGVEKLLQRAYRIIVAASQEDGEGSPDPYRLGHKGVSPGAD
jgi:RNA polymerase sigma-70 factor (ECF subfamily)